VAEIPDETSPESDNKWGFTNVIVVTREPCVACQGRGVVENEPCPGCRGKRFIRKLGYQQVPRSALKSRLKE